MFAKGDKVQQIPAPVISGEVAGFQVDQENGSVLVRVDWLDDDGSTHTKYFDQSEIQAV